LRELPGSKRLHADRMRAPAAEYGHKYGSAMRAKRAFRLPKNAS
jgi:hypothetical protein